MSRGVTKKSLLSMNGGEWSDLLNSRIDLDKYGSACQTLRNMIPTPYGPAKRRVGTQYIAGTKFNAKASRLIDFQFSTATTFIIEAGDLYMRFFANGGQITTSLAVSTASWTAGTATITTSTAHRLAIGDYVTIAGITPSGYNAANVQVTAVPTTTTFSYAVASDPGAYSSGGTVTAPYDIASPYLEADLFQIQWTQINDVMYLTHPEHPPQKLSRISNNSWTLADVEFLIPPMLDENVSTTTLTLAATSGTGVNMTSSVAQFQDPAHVGSKWRVGHRREGAEVSNIPAGTGVAGSTIFVVGTVEFRTYGVWSFEVEVQRQDPVTSNWEAVGIFTSDDDANFELSFTEPELDGAFYRMEVTGFGSNTSGRIVLSRDSYVHYALVEITSVTSTTVAVVDFIVNGISTTATDIWQEGAWSDYRGYPKTSTAFQLRMVYAGSTHQPQTIWASRTDDLENFLYGVGADDSFRYTLGASERNQIEWIVAQKELLIGTSGGEWSLKASDLEGALTPTNGFAQRHATYGSKNIRGLLINNTVLFTQRQGKKLRELVFDITQDNFVAADLTQLAEHITRDGIVDMAYQQQEQSILWAVNDNGELLGMTYERDQNVVAWHRHDTNGSFESVQTIYGTGADEVWFIVNRVIDGNAVRYIERFNPATWTSKDDMFYVDCGLTYDGAATTSITGLEHLKGETVLVLADGHKVTGLTVSSSGVLTLSEEAETVQVGLAYLWEYQPMDIDIDAQAGNTQAEVKRIRELAIKMTQTLGVQVTNELNESLEVPFRDMTNPMDNSPPLFTGTKIHHFDGDNTLLPRFRLFDNGPFNAQLDLIVVKYQITGK